MRERGEKNANNRNYSRVFRFDFTFIIKLLVLAALTSVILS